MSDERMACVSCGVKKQYPDGFPVRHFAECWDCAWNKHIHSDHPSIVRRIKRAARKRARRITARDVSAAMFEVERMQALGVAKEADA